MFAHRNSGLHFFAARRAIAQPHGHVSPFSFPAQADGRAPVQVRNFAEGMAARPHRVAFSDEPVIILFSTNRGSGEFSGGWPGPVANEYAVVLQTLHQV